MAVSFAQAAQIDFALVRATVDERGEALVSHLVSYDSRDGKQVSFRVLDNKNLKVFDSSGPVEFEEKGLTVSFFPKNFVENYGATIEYGTSILTSKQNGDWKFEMQLNPLNEFNELKFELSLPKNAVLSSHSPQGLVFAGEQKLEIEWKFEETTGEQVALSAEYFFSENNQTETGQNPALLLLVGVLVVLTAGGAGYFYYSKQKSKEAKAFEPETVPKKDLFEARAGQELSERQKDLLKILSENEEKIVKELLKEDHIIQRNLLVRTGLPKSTLSRAIKKLEVKGIVKVNTVGNTNRVELSEEFKKKGEP